jgi:phenylacetyl-CoA:acceptor oxidoreductase
MSAIATPAKGTHYVPTYCYQCVAGPDLLRVKVEDGVATEIGPNPAAKGIHPADGRPCVRAYGLVQKTYNPHRVLTPMKRSNPKKGRDEDPQFVAISWDEALDTIGAKLRDIRARGLLDEQGLPRVAASFGHGGTPASYMGSFPAFLAAWGQIDYSLGSGQGVKCVHSEHLYGEFWHRGFTVCADTPHTQFVLSFGANVEVSGGACAVRRHADARVRGVKRVNVEPHLSVTAACSAEWVPIRPKTDAAFMFALLHVLTHEVPLERLDVGFLRDRTASPYLVGPDGYYLREPTAASRCWGHAHRQRAPFDTPGTVPALVGASPSRTRTATWPMARWPSIATPRPRPPSARWSTCCAPTAPNGRPRSATCRRRRCAASRSNFWPTPASARRCRSKAARCRTARWR